MARKKPTTKSHKKSNRVQAPQAGPQNTRRPVTKTNGMTPGVHHLRLHMGKRPGMQTPNGKAACDQWLEPMGDHPPVLPLASSALYLNGATQSTMRSTAPVGGRLIQTRKTFQVGIGTQGLGYILSCPEKGGAYNMRDLICTYATFTGAAINAGETTGALLEPSVNTALPEGFHYTCGARMILAVNDNAALNRNGKVFTYCGPANIGGAAAATFEGTPYAQAYSNNLFTENDELHVRPMVCTSYTYSETTTFSGTLFNHQDSQAYGFVFFGTAGDQFTVTVEFKTFVWGSANPLTPIATTILPIVDTSAIECAAACTAALRSVSVGNQEGDDSRRTRELRQHAERAVVQRTPAPILSTLWPAIEKLAQAAGPVLLKGLSGLL